MEKLNIIPIGKIDQKILDYLKVELERKFGLKVEIAESMESPDYAYNPKRRQYLAEAILERIIKISDGINLGMVDVDLYTPDLNFVFGTAFPLGKSAVISLARLRQEFYGLPKNEILFKERVIKEAIHELGHVFGLNHCRDPECVMHFSNTILDTDKKSSSFCSNCQRILAIKK